MRVRWGELGDFLVFMAGLVGSALLLAGFIVGAGFLFGPWGVGVAAAVVLAGSLLLGFSVKR